MTPTERVAKYIREREESHEDDDMPGESEEFREYYTRTLVELVTGAVNDERRSVAAYLDKTAEQCARAGGRVEALAISQMASHVRSGQHERETTAEVDDIREQKERRAHSRLD